MQVQTRIETKLREAFSPSVLDVQNESGSHNVPRGSETHFKAVVVSTAFEGLGRIERHRAVHVALADELAAGVHALTLTLRTPDEWASDTSVPASPPCLGGSK
jgi:stress-induced morphogen